MHMPCVISSLVQDLESHISKGICEAPLLPLMLIWKVRASAQWQLEKSIGL